MDTRNREENSQIQRQSESLARCIMGSFSALASAAAYPLCGLSAAFGLAADHCRLAASAWLSAVFLANRCLTAFRFPNTGPL